MSDKPLAVVHLSPQQMMIAISDYVRVHGLAPGLEEGHYRATLSVQIAEGEITGGQISFWLQSEPSNKR